MGSRVWEPGKMIPKPPGSSTGWGVQGSLRPGPALGALVTGRKVRTGRTVFPGTASKPGFPARLTLWEGRRGGRGGCQPWLSSSLFRAPPLVCWRVCEGRTQCLEFVLRLTPA